MQVDWAGTKMRLFDPTGKPGAKVSIFVPAQSTCMVCPGACVMRAESPVASTCAATSWRNLS